MEGADQSDYGPTWFSRVTSLPPPRNTLNYEIDVDVCVVGGGLAGLTVAREIVRRGWSVALLEGARIAWNASGRNSGLVMAGYPAAIEKIVERIGLPAARALWALSEEGVGCVRDTIGELGLGGVVQGQGWLEVSKFDDREAAHGRARLLAEEFGVEAEPWSLEQVREVLRTDHYFGAVHYPNAFQINPLAYCLALADAVERAGVFVFENTPALTIDAAGVRKRVDTPDGRVRAGRVVLAGNVHLGDVSKKVAGTLVPVELLALHKAAVNRWLDIQGIRALEQSAADLDCIAHQTDAVKSWMKASRERGLKEALSERDRPFARKK